MSAGLPNISGENEVETVRNAPRELHSRAVSPVTRACLESADADVAHLAGTGGTETTETSP